VLNIIKWCKNWLKVVNLVKQKNIESISLLHQNLICICTSETVYVLETDCETILGEFENKSTNKKAKLLKPDNNLNSNSIGIISLIGPQNSDKSSFANIIIGDKDAFDDSENTDGIYMWRQPIVHQENEDLLVLDTESLYKQSNINTSYDKQTFILF